MRVEKLKVMSGDYCFPCFKDTVYSHKRFNGIRRNFNMFYEEHEIEIIE